MSITTIEWVQGPNGEEGFSFNPWWGCEAVSPGCANCYAAVMAKRTGKDCFGPGKPRIRTSEKNWNDPLRWNRDAEKKGVSYRVFCASMADVFDAAVPDEWRRDLFELILKTPYLDWLILTKRIGNAYEMLGDAIKGTRSWSGNILDGNYKNVWLGITVCNQKEADRDISLLLKVPAAKHFLSMEPLLGPVDIDRHLYKSEGFIAKGVTYHAVPALDWIIVGGESGHNARPMHPDWMRSLRDQCANSGVPFFFKQWGNWMPQSIGHSGKMGAWHKENFWLGFCDIHNHENNMIRVAGKNYFGHNLLDGKEYMEVPA